MTTDLVERALPDVLSFIVDNRGRTCPTATTGVPLIATNCLKVGQRSPALENIRFVDSDTMTNWFRAHPEPGDVLFVCKGSPGRVAVVPDPVPFCIAQDMVALRADPTVMDPTYLYYRLVAPDVQASIAHMHVGTMIPHFKKGDFDKLRFAVHREVEEQRAIAEVLGALDDKIVANDRVLDVLARLEKVEAARAVASASSTVRFESIAGVVSGVSYRSSDLVESPTALVTLKSIDRQGAFSHEGFKPYAGEFKPAQRLESGDIVVAKTDLTQKAEVIGRAVRVPPVDSFDQLVASLDLAVVRPTGNVPAGYILGVLRQEPFREHCLARTSGTTVLHLGRGAIESYEFPLTSEEAMQKYSVEASERAALVDSLIASSEALAKARDELLPLLMSGKARVRDAERNVEAVG